jgi:hypothetical protein
MPLICKSYRKYAKGFAQLLKSHSDIDFEILSTALRYWDPELEKKFPGITDWSVLPE